MPAPDLELRCPNRMHGIIRRNDNTLEVKCNHWRCKDRVKGAVILHYYDLDSGELVRTLKLKEPFSKDVDQARNGQRKGNNVNSVA